MSSSWFEIEIKNADNIYYKIFTKSFKATTCQISKKGTIRPQC